MPEAVNFASTVSLNHDHSQIYYPHQGQLEMPQMQERPDAHDKPPRILQDVYKFYQKVDVRQLAEATSLSVHLDEAVQHEAVLAPSSLELPANLHQLLGDFSNMPPQIAEEGGSKPEVFEICGLPGE
jgi:hypothetical protein